MALTYNSVILPQTPRNQLQTFVEGTDAAYGYKELYSGGADGSKVLGIVATTNDPTVDNELQLLFIDDNVSPPSSTPCGRYAVPNDSGDESATPPVSLLDPDIAPFLPIDVDGNPYIYLPPNTSIQATFTAALTASSKIMIVTFGADY